jgi:hypothetical protein
MEQLETEDYFDWRFGSLRVYIVRASSIPTPDLVSGREYATSRIDS